MVDAASPSEVAGGPLLNLYADVVRWIVRHAPGADKLVHSWVGLAIWVGAALVLRRPLGDWRPLLAVAAAEAANECVDRIALGSWRWPETAADIFTTLFWPAVLTLLLRARGTRPRGRR